MNGRQLIGLVLAGSLFAACSSRRGAVIEETQTSKAPEQAAAAPAEANPPPVPEPTPNFSWGYEGDKGPEAWGSISPDYVACGKGKRQSPINLAWRKPSKKTPRIDFSYTPSQVSVDLSTAVPTLKVAGGNQLLLNGKVYNLDRIEFHSPSEHQLSKTATSMEIQFIHKALNSGNMAAVSIFAIEGHDNPLVADVWAHFTGNEPAFTLDASKLIPPAKTFYHYQGSLTSPPCTEGVEWVVFNTPVEVSQQQIVAFRSRFPANSRPIQPLNGRKPVNF